MRTRLAALGATRDEKSKAIAATLAHHPALQSGRHVAIYSPIPSEPDIELLWKIAPGRFCYPRVADGKMEFVEVEKLEHLITSSWHPHIREHRLPEARVVSPEEIGVIFVPGLAFTKNGHRLGRGGGYYDRYLSSLPASTMKIGICFALQIVDTLPLESHDQELNAVVTEDGLIVRPTPL
ncbi:5-formyltetrahydrofolate cyclo-ligase [Chthoniobacter flavus Ellin428]|uniref:5-formyltetrahydrofolate cyclo-ligase n=2 Tax=Chthoniobacter flavus TaxID=191863 RepID=B4D0W6_9BACT|nr:5-formyltetrahydrofolate cyclo-ligase [Chthoniobacter flavus Ellin428]TCO91753.1 5-formyltetrahydrofolate cyclo-ligase [Chthoniobacter flavus]